MKIFFTEKEMCEFLGIGRQTLWMLRTRRNPPIPYSQVETKILYDKEKVGKWLNKTRYRGLTSEVFEQKNTTRS